MTTIITIVVVALVFFVTICIVAFMVWKREAEMRTDSIKAIESNVEEMLYELTGNSSGEFRRRMKRNEELRSRGEEPQQEMKDKPETDRLETDRVQTETPDEPRRKKNHDPFEWVRAESDSEKDIRREAGAKTAEELSGNVTTFEPAAVQYASFERGGDPSERDGKRGLRWREIDEQQPEESPKEEPQSLQPPPVKAFEPEPGVPAGPEPAALEAETPEPQQAEQKIIEAASPEAQPPEPEITEAQPPEPVLTELVFSEPQQLELQPPEPGPQPSEPQPRTVEELQRQIIEDPEPQIIETIEPQPAILQEDPAPASEEKEYREADEGSPLSRLFKRHKKEKPQQEQEAEARQAEEEQEHEAPVQETYETIEDLLKDYISEPHSEYEEEHEAGQKTYYFEPVRPGYDVGKSGRKYTAAELEALIKE